MNLRKITKLMKSNLFLYSILILLCLTISVFAIGIPRAELMNKSLDSHIKTIILDAGHGGFDSGATAVDGTEEKKLNLEITKKTAAILQLLGYEVICSRTEDVSVNDAGLDTIRQKKNSDLRNRLNLINTTPNCVFISIHQNKFTKSQYRGAQMFYSPNHTDSETLSRYIYNYCEQISTENDRALKQADKNIYVLYNAQNPATILECGFLSNWEDTTLLSSDEYQKKLALCIAFGVTDYFNPQEISSSSIPQE